MSASAGTHKWPILSAALILFLMWPTPASAQAQQSEVTRTAEQQLHLRELAAGILKTAVKANCKPRDCRILVTDFAFSSGMTSPLGVQLADTLARELSSQRNAIPIADRAQLRADLEKQRIVGELLNNEKALRWLGRAAGATAVLEDTIENNGSSLRVSARLLSTEKGKDPKAGPRESFTFSYAGPAEDLAPAEAFPDKPSDADWSSAPEIRGAGKSGSKPPSCISCPDPSYTDAGREAKFIGTAVVQVVISVEGQVTQARIIRGLPFGLNEASLNTVRGWRFHPATIDGSPATVQVHVEVTFRLY